ncbi:MAG: hypothetical protein JRI23_18870 [Deltaproteobacteria bacterium]|nr:hypothetical protein [Deltaproteobacteria bacterium]MBW2533927.1 hypothetical protein [Deltaproteobacteria bacterium]
MRTAWITAACLAGLVAGCAVGEAEPPAVGVSDHEITERQQDALLSFMNAPETSFERLDVACAIRSDSARNIVDHRDGPDGVPGTADDDPFDSTEELDDVHMVGPWTMDRLHECAGRYALLGFMNDGDTSFERLDVGCAIRSDSARNIIAHRDGADGVAGTADDDPFDTVEEIDAVYMVGPWTMERLYECAEEYGYLVPGPQTCQPQTFDPASADGSYYVDTQSQLDPALADVVADLETDALTYADPNVTFPVRFGQVEVFTVDGEPIGYEVELVQTIDPEGGIQLWIVYSVDSCYGVLDVDVSI